VLNYGADRTGVNDATTAIQNAIEAAQAQHKTLWLAAGTYQVNGHLIVDNVTVKGAGQWYTTLTGNGLGVYGQPAATATASSNVHLSDFSIVGQVANRDDGADLNGIGGALNSSTISNLWIQRTKVGMWFDGPLRGLAISNVRVLDQMADGITFHNAISNSSITNSYIRGTGDDGIALNSSGGADTDDVIGTTTIAHNTLVRTGVLDPNWQFGVGALWFYAPGGPQDAADVGRAYADHRDRDQHRRYGVDADRGGHAVPVRPERQHQRDHHLVPGDVSPLHPAVVLQQRPVAGRADRRVRGLRALSKLVQDHLKRKMQTLLCKNRIARFNV
jgi:hypothetical protein